MVCFTFDTASRLRILCESRFHLYITGHDGLQIVLDRFHRIPLQDAHAHRGFRMRGQNIRLCARFCHGHSEGRVELRIQLPVVLRQLHDIIPVLLGMRVDLCDFLICDRFRQRFQVRFHQRGQAIGHRVGFHGCYRASDIPQHSPFSRFAGMTASPLLIEDIFIRCFFCQPHQRYGTFISMVSDSFYMPAFIENTVRLDTVVFEILRRKYRALLVIGALHLFIVAKRQIDIEIRIKAFFQKLCDRIHFRCQDRLAVLCAASIKTSIGDLSGKGWMAPLLFMRRRHYILMRHEDDRLLFRMR